MTREKGRLRLEVSGRVNGFEFRPRKLEAAATAMAVKLRLKPGSSVSLVFCSVPAIRKLSDRHFGRSHATDVIAFPTGFAEVAGLLGEIWIAPSTVAKNGKDFGKGLNGELLFVLAHGLLHLLGERDDTAARRAAMFARQEQLLEACRATDGRLPCVIGRRSTDQGKAAVGRRTSLEATSKRGGRTQRKGAEAQRRRENEGVSGGGRGSSGRSIRSARGHQRQGARSQTSAPLRLCAFASSPHSLPHAAAPPRSC